MSRTLSVASARLDRPARDGKPEAQAAAVGRVLRERGEQGIGLSLGKSAALVLDLDQHALRGAVGLQADVAMRPRELEGVLQQVGDRRIEHLLFRLDPQIGGDGGDGELAAPGLRFQARRHLDLGDEPVDGDRFTQLHGHAGCEAHVGQRAVDEVAQADEAALKHGGGRAVDGDAAALDRREREHRGAEEVAQLVGEEAEPLAGGAVARLRDQLVAPQGELGDGVRDGVVEAAIEGLEFVRRHLHPVLDRQVGDGLAEIPVVMNHLVDRVALPEQLVPVFRGAGGELTGRDPPGGRRGTRDLADLARGVLHAKGLDQLLEEQRDAVSHLARARPRRRACARPSPGNARSVHGDSCGGIRAAWRPPVPRRQPDGWPMQGWISLREGSVR